MKLKMFAARIAAIITTNLQTWHKFTASAWSGANRLPDSSPVGTNTGALFTGRALDFDGVNDVVTIGATGATVKTVIFYANPDTTTQSFMQLQSTGAVRIEISGGTLSATGFTSPTLYVNGVASSTVAASSWQMIAVTSATGVSASNVLMGQSNTSFLNGSLTNVRFFSTQLSAGQIAELYANPEQRWPTGSVNADLVGWWHLDGTTPSIAVDGSISKKNGTISGATTINKLGGSLPQSALQKGNVYYYADGIDDRITFNSDITLLGDFTICFTVFNFSPNAGIISTPGNNTTSWLRPYSSLFSIRINDVTYNLGNVDFLNGFITVVRSGANISVYKNGVFNATTTATSSTFVLRTWLQPYPSSENKMNSLDLQVFNTALSGSQILGLYDGTITPLSVASCVAYFEARTNWADAKGNYTSTVSGSPELKYVPQGNELGKDVIGAPITTAQNGALNLTADAYASIADAATIDITTAITIEAWVKPFTVSATQTIAGKNNAYALNITSGAKLQFSKWTSAANASVASSASIGTTAWTHVAATYTSGACVLYINGAVDTTSAALTGAMDATSTALLLGALTTSTNLFSGCIDNVRVYSVAMTAAQIANNYSAERGSYS